MALFKIFRGPSERLKDVKPTEGYAYFTPDDGKFYIDIRDGEIPVIGNYENEVVKNNQLVNRICINQRLFNYNDFDVLDCGTATSQITVDTIVFDCGNSQE